jgi:hypothetical protein
MLSNTITIHREDHDLFLVYESKLFSFFSSSNESYEDMVKLLEQNCNRLISEYKISHDSKVNIEIYPDLETYHKNMWDGLKPNVDFPCNDQIIGNMDESTNSIKIVTPYNSGHFHNYNTVVKTVLHEFIHVLTMNKFKSVNSSYSQESFMKVLWLHEAIAVYESGQYKDFMPIFLKNIKQKIPSFVDLDNLQFRYILGWSFAEFMSENFSKLQLLDLMTRDGQTKNITGLSENELENKWQDWLEKKYIGYDMNLTQPRT